MRIVRECSGASRLRSQARRSRGLDPPCALPESAIIGAMAASDATITSRKETTHAATRADDSREQSAQGRLDILPVEHFDCDDPARDQSMLIMPVSTNSKTMVSWFGP
jgi:hypothetical protein